MLSDDELRVICERHDKVDMSILLAEIRWLRRVKAIAEEIDVDAIRWVDRSWFARVPMIQIEQLDRALVFIRDEDPVVPTQVEELQVRLATTKQEVTRLQTLIAEQPKRREGFHATYNGGWTHDERENRAYHHGMDTVFNLIDDLAKAAKPDA